MKNTSIILFFILFSTTSYSSENDNHLKLTCQDYSWTDVERLVQPYLDDVLYTALVMQGQSSNYKVSEAAVQAMDKSLPDVIKRILQALIDANC